MSAHPLRPNRFSYRLDGSNEARPHSRFGTFETTDALVRALTTQPAAATALLDANTGKTYTYRELNVGAVSVARRLVDIAPKGQLITLCPTSPVEAVVFVLGALRAGRPFLPLDPLLSDEIVDQVFEQIGGVTFGSGMPRDRHAIGSPWSGLPDQKVGYGMIGNGSGSSPKLALVGQRALSAYVSSIARKYRIRQRDVVLQAAPFGSVAWLEEVMPTLLCGGTVVVTTHDWQLSYRDVVRLIDGCEVTIVNLPVSFWAGWNRHLEQVNAPLPQCLEKVIVNGAGVVTNSARQWIGRYPGRPRLLVAYGLVEAIGTSLVYDVTAFGAPYEEDFVPLGMPIARTRARTVPAGEGELQLAGPALFEGYVDGRDIDTSKLVVDQHGTRWLRTGDRAKQTMKGVLLRR